MAESSHGSEPATSGPQRTLRGRLVGSFLTLSLVTVGLLAAIAFVQSRSALRDSVFDRLNTVAIVKEGILNRWVEQQLEATEFLATRQHIRSATRELASVPRNSEAYKNIQERVNQQLAVARRRADIKEVFIMTPVGGEIVASSNPERIGEFHVDDSFFARGKRASFIQNVYASPITGRPTLTIATPAIGDDGETIVVVAANLNLERIDTILAERTGLGESGEAYIVSAFNDFVSSERFGRDEYRRGVHSVGVNEALAGRSGVGLYENYAGTPVIGAFRWIGERQLALIIEMAQSEATSPARSLVWTILGAGLVSALVLTFGVRFLASQIAEPVVSLAEAAKRVAAGDFSAQSRVTTDDELGVLSRVFNDMTERLQLLYSDLTEQIAKTSETLDELARARDEAESATRVKSEFLASMSHEIRTPLNAVIGMTHLMLETELDTKQRDYAEKVHSSAGHLLSLVNDVLDLSKMDAKRLDIEDVRFELDELLSRLLALLTPPKEGVELIFDVRPRVPRFLGGDSLRLGQILANLLSNAIKFTEKGEIHLSVDLLESHLDFDELVFAVRDTGIGLASDEADRLFEAFTQADGSTTRRFGGTGLGLTISRQLVELMGGSISATGERGRGSCFEFTARFSRSAEESAEAPLRGIDVLVAHTNATARQVLTTTLEYAGASVNITDSPMFLRETLARGGTADIVVTDSTALAETDLDPHDLVTSAPAVPVCLLVHPVKDSDGARGRNSASEPGILEIVNQPFTRTGLIDAVKRCLEGKSQAQEEPRVEKEGLLANLEVLVVEDNAINQQVVRELLEHGGARVEVASGGREALSNLEKQSYDVVLLDIQMPDIDGFDVARRIRTLVGGKPSSVIALSADPNLDPDRLKQHGFDDYLTKPIDPDHLIRAISSRAKASTRRSTTARPSTSLDMRAGIARVAGNEHLYWQLLQSFSDAERSTTAEIADWLATGEMDRAAQKLHNMKGVAANLGAEAVADAADRLAAAVADSAVSPHLIPSLEKALLDVEQRLTTGPEDGSRATSVESTMTSPKSPRRSHP